ncbi:hypothetical protein ACWC0C_06975 [Streptomyces sp. NPDC001709]
MPDQWAVNQVGLTDRARIPAARTNTESGNSGTRVFERLHHHTQQRIRDAVDWLTLEGPAARCGTGTRALAALVLAKTPADGDRWVRTDAPFLARHLGLSPSATEKLLAEGRKAGALETRRRYQTTEDGGREVVGVDIRLIVPNPSRRHPLARLGRPELAVFHRLLTTITDPAGGLLAARTGRGATTERLAALHLVLRARLDGTVRMTGGHLDHHQGRNAATLAPLLRMSADGAAKVLGRLEEADFTREDVTDAATGATGRTLLRIPAAAHRTARLEAVKPDFRPPYSAEVRGSSPEGTGNTQVTGTQDAGNPEIEPPYWTEEYHAVHASKADLDGQAEVSRGSSAEGASRLSHDGGYAHERAKGPGALRAETKTPAPHLQHIPTEIRAALPGLFEAMTPGQQDTAARDVAACLDMWQWDAVSLAERLTGRFAPMTLTDPGAGRSYITNPLGWLRAQLPARALTVRQESAARDQAEHDRRERLADGIDPAAACAAVAARLAAEAPASAARRAALDVAHQRHTAWQTARDQARDAIHTDLTERGFTGVALSAWLAHHMRTWDSHHPEPPEPTTATRIA